MLDKYKASLKKQMLSRGPHAHHHNANAAIDRSKISQEVRVVLFNMCAGAGAGC